MPFGFCADLLLAPGPTASRHQRHCTALAVRVWVVYLFSSADALCGAQLVAYCTLIVSTSDTAWIGASFDLVAANPVLRVKTSIEQDQCLRAPTHCSHKSTLPCTCTPVSDTAAGAGSRSRTTISGTESCRSLKALGGSATGVRMAEVVPDAAEERRRAELRKAGEECELLIMGQNICRHVSLAVSI